MPEGHLVHRYARRQAALVGQPVAASSPQGRFRAGAAAVDGRVLDAVDAHGKHLLHRFGDDVVHTHLGMQGAWAELPSPPPASRPQCRFRLSAAAATWDLFAPSACELLDTGGVSGLLAGLGPDPLRGDDPAPTFERLATSPVAIGEALLDQSLFAGVGNVLRSEALAACGVDPRRPARDVDPRPLWDDLVVRMEAAAEAGEIAKAVYKHDRCARCGAPVEAFDLPRGRTAYACTVEQLAA